MCYLRDLSDIHFQLLSLQSIRKPGIIKTLQQLHLQTCCFGFDCKLSLIPAELQIELEIKEYIIPPVVYAQFLRFLCHYHLNSYWECRESLGELQRTIAEKYFIPESNALKAESFNCVGIYILHYSY